MSAQAIKGQPAGLSVMPPELRQAGWRVRRDNKAKRFFAENERAGLRTELFDKDFQAVERAGELQAERDGAPEKVYEAPLSNGNNISQNNGETSTLLDVGLISTSGGTQARAALDEVTVADYAEAMLAGDRFPPVIVFYDGSEYWLADGFHRHAATLRAELTEIAAEVRQGTRRDAILYAVGANARHGLRRSNADKRRAVETLLTDSEWSKWSNRQIAEKCGVTHTFVGDIRAELSGSRSQMEATARRKGSTYTVKTERIGSNQKIKETPAGDPSREAHAALTEQHTPESAPFSSEESKGSSTSAPAGATNSRTTARPQTEVTDARAIAPSTEPDPEGWSELPLVINLAIRPGKSAKRGITVSGRAGEGKPVFLTSYTLADLEPQPPALRALLETMKRDFAKGSSKVAAARSKAGKGKVRS